MPQLGRFNITLQDRLGNALDAVDIEIRRQSAQVNGAQSGTSPFTVNVRHPGGLVALDTIRIGTGTTEYSVQTVTGTTVVLTGFSGTLVLSDGDRLGPVNDLPSMYDNAAGGGSPLSDLATDEDGRASCHMEIVPYQMYFSGGGLSTPFIREDEIPAGFEKVTSHQYPVGTGAAAYQRDTERALAAADRHTVWMVNGTPILSLWGDGDVDIVKDLAIAGDLSIGDDLTVTGDLAVTGNATITGDLTVDDITADDISVGDLTVSGAVSLPAGAIETADLAANAIARYSKDTSTGVSDVALTTSEVVRSSIVDYTPTAGNAGTLFIVQAPYDIQTGATVGDRSYAVARLYIGGTLKALGEVGAINTGGGIPGENAGWVTFTHFEPAMSTTPVLVELKEIRVDVAGTGTGNYKGTRWGSTPDPRNIRAIEFKR